MSASAFVHNFAFVIGINQYENGIPPLQTAVNDADAIATLLETQHDYDVERMVDQAATLDRLRYLLQTTLPNQVLDDDRVLIYFAGHGIAHQGMMALLDTWYPRMLFQGIWTPFYPCRSCMMLSRHYPVAIC